MTQDINKKKNNSHTKSQEQEAIPLVDSINIPQQKQASDERQEEIASEVRATLKKIVL